MRKLSLINWDGEDILVELTDEEIEEFAEKYSNNQIPYMENGIIKWKFNDKKFLTDIRTIREEECFTIINRGQFWYDNLTVEQKQELKTWYIAWLNVTVTKEIPIKPEWL